MVRTLTLALERYTVLRYAIGGLCVCIGFAALVTPLTPGSWLIIIGLQLVGLRLLSREKVRGFFNKYTTRGAKGKTTRINH